jgi:hypothetical protein
MSEHRSFILRIRNDEPDQQKQPCWRYVLLDPEREYRQSFTSLDQLFKVLTMEICSGTSAECTFREILSEVEE